MPEYLHRPHLSVILYTETHPYFQVILDEPGVKEEPQDVDEEVTETKEIIESQFSFDPITEGGDSRSDPGGGGGGYDPQMMGSQPQSMEDLVAQAIPGSSGLQGVSTRILFLTF